MKRKLTSFVLMGTKRKNKVEKRVKILLSALCTCIVLGWCSYYLKNDERNSIAQARACKVFRNASYKGVVEGCFINYRNKGTYSFKLKGNNDTLTMWKYGNTNLENGDSIVKEAGESKYIIYKHIFPDSVLVLKFNCGD